MIDLVLLGKHDKFKLVISEIQDHHFMHEFKMSCKSTLFDKSEVVFLDILNDDVLKCFVEDSKA